MFQRPQQKTQERGPVMNLCLVAGAARLLTVAAGLLLTPGALAQTAEVTEENRASMDRFFPLSESAATPPTYVRAETAGQATSSEGAGYSVSQRVELVVVRGLSLRVGAELRNSENGFTPSAQAKYQFLRQAAYGLNMSAGLRYKQQGFQSTGGEAEAFVAAGKCFGRVLATANFVVGRELSSPEGDVEGHLGLGYLLMESLVVGLNMRYQHEFETEKAGRHPGREFELMSGAMVGYGIGIAELSLLGGYYMPRASNAAGSMGMLRLGLNF